MAGDLSCFLRSSETPRPAALSRCSAPAAAALRWAARDLSVAFDFCCCKAKPVGGNGRGEVELDDGSEPHGRHTVSFEATWCIDGPLESTRREREWLAGGGLAFEAFFFSEEGVVPEFLRHAVRVVAEATARATARHEAGRFRDEVDWSGSGEMSHPFPDAINEDLSSKFTSVLLAGTVSSQATEARQVSAQLLPSLEVHPIST